MRIVWRFVLFVLELIFVISVGYSWVFFFFFYEGRCYFKCLEGFYVEDGVCECCSFFCRMCEGNIINCYFCEGGFVLYYGVCWEICFERYVVVEGVCKYCLEMC